MFALKNTHGIWKPIPLEGGGVIIAIKKDLEMDERYLVSRNAVQGFVDRTLKNLLAIEADFERGDDVHVVTQLVISMVGLIVFPIEEDTEKTLVAYTVKDLNPEGREIWHFTHGKSANLHDHLRHLRNAIAHRHLEFSSDDRSVENVVIEFSNISGRTGRINWQAEINANDLRSFCLAFAQRLREL
jgi:hypothetical protein